MRVRPELHPREMANEWPSENLDTGKEQVGSLQLLFLCIFVQVPLPNRAGDAMVLSTLPPAPAAEAPWRHGCTMKQGPGSPRSSAAPARWRVL